MVYQTAAMLGLGIKSTVMYRGMCQDGSGPDTTSSVSHKLLILYEANIILAKRKPCVSLFTQSQNIKVTCPNY